MSWQEISQNINRRPGTLIRYRRVISNHSFFTVKTFWLAGLPNHITNQILDFKLQELRLLKNFSSLKAIISGLQSNPIYRLKRAWSYVLREKLEIFEELARIFSGENNALAQRELLVREGTARFADTVGENDHHMQKILQKHSENSRVRAYFQIFILA